MQIISLLIIFFSLISFNTHASDQDWKPAQDGDKIILIRHALAPGRGDPKGFKIDDCKTQRNLDNIGIDQSKKIGKLFQEKKIKIDQVLTSQWCRCIDTAKLAFSNYEIFSALNSFYDIRFEANEERQITQLKEFINQWNGKENIIFVTHFVVISSMLNIGTSSGEIVITDKNLNIIGSIDTL